MTRPYHTVTRLIGAMGNGARNCLDLVSLRRNSIEISFNPTNILRQQTHYSTISSYRHRVIRLLGNILVLRFHQFPHVGMLLPLDFQASGDFQSWLTPRSCILRLGWRFMVRSDVESARSNHSPYGASQNSQWSPRILLYLLIFLRSIVTSTSSVNFKPTTWYSRPSCTAIRCP